MFISEETMTKCIESGKKGGEIIRKRAIDNYDKNPKRCLYCNEIIPYKVKDGRRKFCNQSCAAKYNNHKRDMSSIYDTWDQKRIDNNKTPIDRNKKICICGKEIINKNKYCSINCQHKHSRLNKINSLINGDHSGIGLHFIKRYLMETIGKCEICGWKEINQFTNTIPLEMHHKDGNSDNNLLENLLLICPNCHSLQNFQKGNYDPNMITKRRNYRKKRYREIQEEK